MPNNLVTLSHLKYLRYDEDDDGNQSGGPESKNVIISENENRYNLRLRKAVDKTVRLTDIKVNKTVIGSGSKLQNSILKHKNYSPQDNFELKNFKLGDKFYCSANKKALLQHVSNVQQKTAWNVLFSCKASSTF